MRTALIVVALIVGAGTLPQLLHAQQRQTASSDVAPQTFAVVTGSGEVCESQAGPAGTAAYELTIGTFGAPPPQVDLEVHDAAGATVARGSLEAGFTQGVVQIGLAEPVPRGAVGTEVCLRWDGPRLAFGGEADRVSLRPLADGEPTLASVLDDAARRLPRGNAGWLGSWTLVLIAMLTAAGIGLAATAIARPGPGRVVGAALLVGAAWALLVPPFHVPDENAHFAYVAHIAETGDLPPSVVEPRLSEAETATLTATNFGAVTGKPAAKPPWTAAQEDGLRAVEDADLDREPEGAGTAGANPPLYYAAQLPAYFASRGGSVLDQLLAMRIVSVLLCGLTALFCWLFLRELLPRSPWAWPAGALAVALQPLFGFMGTGVNADALLFAASAGTFWLIALVLRRGLDLRRALGLGAMLAAGALTKPLFLALVPGALLALAVAAARARDRAALRFAAIAVAVALAPVLAYHVIGSAVTDHPYFQTGSTVSALSGDAETAGAKEPSRREQASYIWQLWAPRLPFQQDLLPGLPLRSTWFDGFVGRFGWLDYAFPAWVTGIAVWIAFALLVAAAVALWRRRPRWLDLACLAAGAGGLAVAIGAQQYNVFVADLEGAYTQARYLLPLLALYGGLVAVAVHAAGRRWAPAVTGVLVGLAGLHVVASMLLTISRYYA